MGGGLLNIVSNGASSIFLFGNPQKSMFYKTYKSITNFGMQRFRLECDKKMPLNMADETKISFKVERHADMLGDTHLVMNLPDIWFYNDGTNDIKMNWVDELGTTMIEEIVVESGGTILAKYSGEYLSLVEHRDNANKLGLWYDMIGSTDELNNNDKDKRTGDYPNIRSRKLYIPLNCWFTRGVDQALPLVSLQYSIIYIHIRIRPLKELYRIKCGEGNWEAPKLNDRQHRFTKFLKITNEDMEFDWDIHLISTYYFLDDKERNAIAKKDNKYLVKDVYQYTYHHLHGNSALNLESRGLVIGYQFRFRRSDVSERNEWTNYTNFLYKSDTYSTVDFSDILSEMPNYHLYEEILKNFRLIIDGNDRENVLDVGVMKYIEPYTRSNANGKKGVYHYNFTINTDLNEYQPYGAMNMDKFDEINLHIQTIEPPVNTENQITQCAVNPITGFEEIVQTSQDIFDYTFDLEVFEERYNIIVIKNGIIGTFFAR